MHDPIVSVTALDPETLRWMLDCERERRTETLDATVNLQSARDSGESPDAIVEEYARDHRN